jgi:AcrR family transcriptional regulator
VAATQDEKQSGPRSRKGERTRARLLDAAKRVFEEDGFLDARISDIAERAGLSHGSFYHYFDSKEQIFLEVAEAQEDRFTRDAVVESGMLDRSTAPEISARVAASVRRYLEDYRAEAAIMGVIEQVSRYHAPVRDIRTATQAHYVRQVEASIVALQQRDLADPNIDATVVASALTAMVARFAELWFVQGQLHCTFEEGVETLSRLCVSAMKLKDPVSRRARAAGAASPPGRAPRA